MAGTLRIIRENEWYASGLPLKVYIDGSLQGSVRRNEYKNFNVPSDVVINLKVEIDVFCSPLTPINVPKDKLVIFKIGMPGLSDMISIFSSVDKESIALIPVSTDYRA